MATEHSDQTIWPLEGSNARLLMVSAGGDPRSARSWSGTPYYMTLALMDEFAAVEHLQPSMIKAITLATSAARATARLSGRPGAPHASKGVMRINSFAITHAEKQTVPDAIFAPAGSTMIANLSRKITQPVVYTSDATVRLMKGYYRGFTDLDPPLFDKLDRIEQAAIDRADLLLYPTEWAARSAISDYGADPAKVHIVPYGVNLRDIPPFRAKPAPGGTRPLRLIFVGVDWVRKGGDIAIEAVEALNARGIDTRLVLVGCSPPEGVPKTYIEQQPFMDKNDPDQARALSELYLSADMLFVPTRAECFGIVWCEAAAHGLPSISTATGGVPDVIREGVTGHTLPPDAGAAEYATLIEALVRDTERFQALRQSARKDYETRLNWQSWARSFRELLAPLLQK